MHLRAELRGCLEMLGNSRWTAEAQQHRSEIVMNSTIVRVSLEDLPELRDAGLQLARARTLIRGSHRELRRILDC